MQHASERQRLDKWLWAARFYKTRALASDEIQKGRIQVNGQSAKPGRELKVGDEVVMRQGLMLRTVHVLGLNAYRGPAPVAQQMYQETPESIERAVQQREARRFQPEPAHSIEHGRPTKRDRRELSQTQTQWDDRWSASLD